MRLPATGDVRATAAQHASFRRFADIGDHWPTTSSR